MLLRSLFTLFSSGMTAFTLAVGSAAAADLSKTQSSTHASAGSEFIIWTWDCSKQPRWRKIIRVASSDLAERAVRRLSGDNQKEGRYFVYTTGEVPQQKPECQPRLAASPKKVAARAPQLDKLAHGKRRNENPHVGSAEEFMLHAAPMLGIAPSQQPSAQQPSTQQPQQMPQPQPLSLEAPIATKGQLRLLSPAKHQFGAVAQGSEARHTFRLKNSGHRPVKIELAERSCGCTGVKINGKPMRVQGEQGEPLAAPVAILPGPSSANGEPAQLSPIPVNANGNLPAPTMIDDVKHEIPGNTTALIEVGVKTSRGPGPFHQHVTLKTDEAIPQSISLDVEGEVVPVLETSRLQIDFGTVRAGEAARMTMNILSRFAENFNVEAVDCTNSDIRVEFSRLPAAELRKLDRKQGVQLVVQVSESAAVGTMDGEIIVYTDLPEMETIRIPLMGAVKSDAVMLPVDRLELGLIEKSRKVTGGLFVRITSSEKLLASVRSVSPEGLNVTLTVAKSADTRETFLILETQLNSGTAPGRLSGSIELQTNLPSAKIIRIPVSGWIAERPAAISSLTPVPVTSH